MHTHEILNRIGKPCVKAQADAKKRWDTIAKPLESLGKLEDLIIKSAGFLGHDGLCFQKKCVVVMCADNGIVMEGVTQVASDVTATVAENMTYGKATINVMADICGASVFVVDIGIARDMDCKGMIQRKVMYGTNNFLKEPAMSREQAYQAIEVGINMVKDLKEEGFHLIATGEMGIGNTTTSSAITASLLKRSAEEVTGRGAGLSDSALHRKIAVIEEGLALHKPDAVDPIDVLSKVGGLDIAGLTGVFIGGAVYRVPILIDGFISSVAALLAVRLCSDVKNYIFATHLSNEPAGVMLLKELDLPVLLDLKMCLGEGTGAVLAFPIFDMALAVYQKMSSFAEANVETYKKQK